MIWRLCIVIVSLTIGACADSDLSSRSKILASSATPAHWPVHLTVSGGFAGLIRQINVQQDRTVTTSDRRRSDAYTGTLNQTEYEQLNSLLAALPNANAAKSNKKTFSTCADCYQYKLILHYQNKPQTFQLYSQALPDSPYKPLIVTLIKLMDQYPSTE